MDLLSLEYSSFSIVAPVISIGLAIVTRRVLWSLTAGIIVGALQVCSYDVVNAANYMLSTFISVFWADNGLNTSNVYIVLFLVLLGVTTSFITLSGGTKAFGVWARNHVKSRRSTEVFVVILGVIIFVDDYFNSLAVGNISRPLTDEFGVSRAKLAYLIDSTAAPICVIAPVSSWGAYIISLVGPILVIHGVTDISPFFAFLNLTALNFYALFSIVFVFLVAWFGLSIGPMCKHDINAVNGILYDESKGIPPGSSTIKELGNGRVIDLVVPILILVAMTCWAIVWTGAQKLETFSILGAFENTDVSTSLVIGAASSLICSSFMLMRRKPSVKIVGLAFWDGVKSMFSAICILVVAWILVDVIGQVGTGKYLAGLVSGSVPVSVVPALVFLVSVAMSFSTGSSWGTFSLMLPITGDMAAATDISNLMPMMSAVLAGAVFGDHCSPVSDTTILSSTGASCHHMDHVVTQLPYCLAIGLVSLCGYLALGITNSIMVGFLVAFVAFALIFIWFRYLTIKNTCNNE